MRHSLLSGALLVAVFGSLVACPARALTEDVAIDTLALLRDELGLKIPIVLERIVSYRGGAIGGALCDSAGEELEFAWDGGARIIGASRESLPRLAYLDADHWSEPGARPLEAGSQGELALLVALQSWVDQHIARKKQSDLYAIYFDYSRPWSERNELTGPLSEDQKRALLALQLVRSLTAQREGLRD